eukprot:1477872-Pyramimonas_sp.AAC.1
MPRERMKDDHQCGQVSGRWREQGGRQRERREHPAALISKNKHLHKHTRSKVRADFLDQR